MKHDLSKIGSLAEQLDMLHELDYDDLIYDHMKLTIEYHNIKRFLTPKESRIYRDFIYLYEIEKSMRNTGKKEYASYMLGPRSIYMDHMEIDEDDL